MYTLGQHFSSCWLWPKLTSQSYSGYVMEQLLVWNLKILFYLYFMPLFISNSLGAKLGHWPEKLCRNELWLGIENCKCSHRGWCISTNNLFTFPYYPLLRHAVPSVKRKLFTLVKDVEWELRKVMHYLLSPPDVAIAVYNGRASVLRVCAVTDISHHRTFTHCWTWNVGGGCVLTFVGVGAVELKLLYIVLRILG
jgi:hypothetical protein